MFMVVEFEESEGGGIAIVRSSWLTPRKKEVFWPPHKHSVQFTKTLKQNEPVDPENWSLYKIKRSFYETNDYELARAKLKKAEDTSDLQSEVEVSKKRRKKATRRLSYEDSSDENLDISCIKRPPIVKRIDLDSLQSFTEGTNVEECLELQESESYNSTPSCSFSKNSNVELQKSESYHSSPSCSFSKSSNVEPQKDTNQEFQRKIFNILFTIKEQNSQIITLLANKKNDELLGNALPEMFPKLPVNNMVDIDKLETLLNSRENLNLLITYLIGIGGKDSVTKTNRILKTLLSDELASKYNFYGKRDKKPFCALKLKSAVVEAVKCNSATTEKEVEDNIKVWLKHSPQRLSRAKAKK